MSAVCIFFLVVLWSVISQLGISCGVVVVVVVVHLILVFMGISYLEESFKRCLNSARSGVSLWQPVTYVTMSNFLKK